MEEQKNQQPQTVVLPLINPNTNDKAEITVDLAIIDMIAALPAEIQKDAEKILALMGHAPKYADQMMDSLLKKHDKNDELDAFAALTYYFSGKKLKALQVIDWAFKRNHSSLLIKAVYARLCVLQGHMGAIMDIFESKLDLISLVPEGTIKAYEFFEVAYALGLFFTRAKYFEPAEFYLQAIGYVANNHPHFRELREEFLETFKDQIDQKLKAQEATQTVETSG